MRSGLNIAAALFSILRGLAFRFAHAIEVEQLLPRSEQRAPDYGGLHQVGTHTT